ncbi:hypothetical protein GCM10023147_16350 [Tsukamurella soli]|uniref:Ribbon-helix-helix protein, copG family n=1 Tax=Tsukamurella soli TaxID=644556 RepID=A0ABP8JEC3_9ACTN
MASTITFRPDDDARLALDELTSDGTSVSTAVRSALIEAARGDVPARGDGGRRCYAGAGRAVDGGGPVPAR